MGFLSRVADSRRALMDLLKRYGVGHDVGRPQLSLSGAVPWPRTTTPT